MKLITALLIACSPALFAQQTIGHTTLFPSVNDHQYVVALQSSNPATVKYGITIAYTLNGSPAVLTQHAELERLFYPLYFPQNFFTAHVFTLIPEDQTGTFTILSTSIEEIQAPAVFAGGVS